MMSKAELEALAEKYEAKAERSYQNYQETGISRYDRERRNAEELAAAMRMAAQASDDYNKLTFIKFEVSILADRAKTAMREPEDKRCEAMEKALKSLVSFAASQGLTNGDELL